MDGLVGALVRVLAVLPPPPRPDVASGGDSGSSTVPWIVGIATAVVVAFGVGLVVGRAVVGRRARAARPAIYRIELWRNGEAEVLGYGNGDATGAMEANLAALRAKRGRGAVVLIEPISDAIVALRPVATEEPPWTRPVARGWSTVPRPIAATR